MKLPRRYSAYWICQADKGMDPTLADALMVLVPVAAGGSLHQVELEVMEIGG